MTSGSEPPLKTEITSVDKGSQYWQAAPENLKDRSAVYEIFIFLLTVLSLANALVWLIFRNDSWTQIVASIDLLISFILLLDFAIRFKDAPNRRKYMIHEWGWADFIGSLPIPVVRLFRLFRLASSAKRLREMNVRQLWRETTRTQSSSGLAVATLLLLLLLEFGGIVVLNAEEGQPGSTIETGRDAIWWSVVTVTTVGYGDYVPVTTTGQIVAVFIMVMGIGLTSVLTGFISTVFLRSTNRNQGSTFSVEDVDELKQSIAELRSMVANLESTQTSGNAKAISDSKTDAS